jgi:hypothetical protein
MTVKMRAKVRVKMTVKVRVIQQPCYDKNP